MATNVTRSQQVAGAAAQTAVAKDSANTRNTNIAEPLQRKTVGYGLPCSKCHLYYPADLDACPTCKHNERVSPVAPRIPAKPVQATPDPIPDTAVLEQDREEFLRQFNAQLMEAHAGSATAPKTVCKKKEHHSGEAAEAEV
jgi:hypothetical protein